jgi:sugar phosphate isomerase/epimerase
MKHVVDRRRFLKTSAGLVAGIGLAGLGRSRLPGAALAGGTPNAEKLGWRLACQTYTFNRFSFYETLQKVASAGLRHIEAYASQPLTKEKPESRTNASMTAAERSEVKKRLADAGIQLAGYYSIRLSSDEGECRREFEFAREMSLEMLVCDAPRRAVDVIEKLAGEYGINVALHNHDWPSPHWNADSLRKLCETRGPRIGICGDTGYWLRAGMNPVDMVGKLGGRLTSLYLKDVNQPGRIGAHDVPFGTGVGDVKGVMAEIHRQGVKPLFVIEYTYHWDESLAEVAQCVEYFDQTAAGLGAG